jgi:hypothetical protein
MAEFRVPDRFRSALIQLSGFSDDVINELSSTLEANPDVLTSRHAAFENASKLTKLTAEEGFPVIEALVPILYVAAAGRRSTDEVVQEVVNALTTGKKDEPKLTKSSIPEFKKNLSKVLSLAGLTLKAKALSIATENERLYSEAKILSDIRPIFGDKVSEAPLGAALLHSLRIAFAEDGQTKELFVTLDTRDLRELQECITRALEKDKTLRNLIGQANLKIFDSF